MKTFKRQDESYKMHSKDYSSVEKSSECRVDDGLRALNSVSPKIKWEKVLKAE